MSLNLDILNTGQKKAVLHRDGPLLILAGAGSGKTRTMSYRIAWLILHHKIPPHSLLGLSFTNKAATELKDRVVTLLRKKNPDLSLKGITLCTFHSLCVRILRQYADLLGFQKNFTILDSSDQESILRDILRKIQIDDRKFDPKSLLSRISHAKNSLDLSLIEKTEIKNIESAYDVALLTAFPHYQQTLKSQNAMDFDDLLFYTVKLLENHEVAREFYNKKYQFILVDEYQDTNGAQFRILKALTQKQENICVVGDDDQSIYAWRGADPTHILNFHKFYPGAEKITLDQNYRSTTKILEAANTIIEKNTQRHPKVLWSKKGEGEPLSLLLFEDDREEAKGVALEISCSVKGERGEVRNYGDFAILLRSNPQSRIFEEELRAQQIPYELIGSYSFLDRKEIKDILSYLKLITNPKEDTAFRRILNWPKRNFGKITLEKINQYALQKNLSLFESLETIADILPKHKDPAVQFRNLILKNQERLLQQPPSGPFLSEWLLEFIDEIGFQSALFAEEEDPKKAQNKLDNVRELGNALGQMNLVKMEAEFLENGGAHWSSLIALRTYISNLLLQSMDEEEDKELDSPHKVKIMTIHSAKGLEFPVVFMVGMDEGLFPHKRVLEEGRDLSEERRLCYVGMTRAKEKLYLTRSKYRVRYGKKIPQNESRFISDLPKDKIEMEDLTLSPEEILEKTKEEKKAHEERVVSFLEQIRNRISK